MSFDDYANHIYQKHRLAVALAIIKSKPPNLKTDKYLEEVKSKIDQKMDDDNFTVCSDDFLMEDDEMNDSVTILKDFDPAFVNNDENGHPAASEKLPTIPENLSQITYYDSSQTQYTENIGESLTTDRILSQDNQISDIEQSILRNSSKDNNERNLLDIDNKCNHKAYSKATGNSNCKPIDKTLNESMDVTYYDSQKTLLYTVHGFTQNYSHYSPSQSDMLIPNKYLYGVNKNANTVQNENNTKDFENETHFVSNGNSSNDKTVENSTNKEEIEYMQSLNMFSQSNDDNFDVIQNIDTHLDGESNRTKNNINITVKEGTENNNIQNLSQFSQNDEENDTRNNFPIEINDMNKNGLKPEIANMDITDEVFEYSQHVESLSHEIQIHNTITEKDKEKSNNNVENKFTCDESNAENLAQNSKKLATVEASGTDSSVQNKHSREEYKIAEEEYESEEVISYKVLEEFNKVKSFLSRQNRRMSCDGYSTDSGYRSDSQRSNNRSALQLSGNWLNQSGCCLFNYIMQCPLVQDTRDMTNEIAQVLSQFIDRLHEEEKYPSFLEDLLETMDLLLRQVYEGETSEDSEFLRKDQNIQRILLLSKSIHIQKHSIEKMSNILETFHSKLTEIESTYELSNIDQIENITYIFHLLEILLKKYLKNREVLSQASARNSQDDEKIFKKNSISDIWRKKWNPSQKVFEGSREKKCVLKNCSEILNKIVVDCVSSYSLVAYSALKCFNSMQT